MSESILDELETIDLGLVKIVVERVTVVKFRMDYGSGSGGGSFEVNSSRHQAPKMAVGGWCIGYNVHIYFIKLFLLKVDSKRLTAGGWCTGLHNIHIYFIKLFQLKVDSISLAAGGLCIGLHNVHIYFITLFQLKVDSKRLAAGGWCIGLHRPS
jgi:hypothetical protein